MLPYTASHPDSATASRGGSGKDRGLGEQRQRGYSAECCPAAGHRPLVPRPWVQAPRCETRRGRCAAASEHDLPNLGPPNRPTPGPELRTRTEHSQKAWMDNAALNVPRNLQAGTDPSSFQVGKVIFLFSPERRGTAFPFLQTTGNYPPIPCI